MITVHLKCQLFGFSVSEKWIEAASNLFWEEIKSLLWGTPPWCRNLKNRYMDGEFPSLLVSLLDWSSGTHGSSTLWMRCCDAEQCSGEIWDWKKWEFTWAQVSGAWTGSTSHSEHLQAQGLTAGCLLLFVEEPQAALLPGEHLGLGESLFSLLGAPQHSLTCLPGEGVGVGWVPMGGIPAFHLCFCTLKIAAHGNPPCAFLHQQFSWFQMNQWSNKNGS